MNSQNSITCHVFRSTSLYNRPLGHALCTFPSLEASARSCPVQTCHTNYFSLYCIYPYGLEDRCRSLLDSSAVTSSTRCSTLHSCYSISYSFPKALRAIAPYLTFLQGYSFRKRPTLCVARVFFTYRSARLMSSRASFSASISGSHSPLTRSTSRNHFQLIQNNAPAAYYED